MEILKNARETSFEVFQKLQSIWGVCPATVGLSTITKQLRGREGERGSEGVREGASGGVSEGGRGGRERERE